MGAADTGPKLPERKRGMTDLPYDVSLAKRPNGVFRRSFKPEEYDV